MHSPSRKWQIKHIKSKRFWDVLRIWESRLAEPNTWKTKIQEFEVFVDLGSTTGNELHNRPGSQVLCKVELVKHSICRRRCIKEIPVWHVLMTSLTSSFYSAFCESSEVPQGKQETLIDCFSLYCTARDYTWIHCTRLHLNTLHYTIMHCTTLNYTAMSHFILR